MNKANHQDLIDNPKPREDIGEVTRVIKEYLQSEKRETLYKSGDKGFKVTSL